MFRKYFIAERTNSCIFYLINISSTSAIVSHHRYNRESHFKSPGVHDFLDGGRQGDTFFVGLFLQSLPKVVLLGVAICTIIKSVKYIFIDIYVTPSHFVSY